MNGTPHRNRFIDRLRSTPVLVMASIVVICAAFIIVPKVVKADSIQDEINALQSDNSQSQSQLGTLESQAGSYQATVNDLQSQINLLQSQIADNQAQQTKINNEITQDQLEIKQQKAVLADDIQTMYESDQLTPVEMLATSNDISTYVDQQESYNALQDKIQSTLQQVATLEKQLQTQKTQVQELLSSENTQNTELSEDQSAQSQLLSYNQTQQSSLNSQIASNNNQIAQLQAEKAEQLQALEGSSSASATVTGSDVSGTGGYPWWNAPCPLGSSGGDTCGDYDWAYPAGASVPDGAPTGSYDPWGYEYRNCTSYVAWKIASTSTSPIIDELISGLGNAAQWPSAAANEGLNVSYGSNPQVGDAAVDPSVADGQGHVMYIDSINSDGSLNVSQYNAVPGDYSTGTISASEVSDLDYIQFPGM